MPKTRPQPGDIRRFGLQSDIYEMPYRLVEQQGAGCWLAERMEPDEHSLALMAALEGQSRYINVAEDLDAALAAAGTTFHVRLVSHAEWAAAF